MAGTGTEVKGIWYGEQILSDLEIAVAKANDESAERIAARARVLVPYDESAKTTKEHPMHLRDTIRVRSGRKRRNKTDRFVIAGWRDKGVFWHWMVEYGTYFGKGYYFMRTAVDANFNSHIADMERHVNREFNKVRRESVKSKKFHERFTLG